MKNIKEDAIPTNATGPGVVGTDGDTSFSPRLFAMVKRAALEKKKNRNGREK
jgi:hypothetical protein